MRILLIHQVFVSGDQPGGTRHLELLSHLVQQGHQCTVVASDTSYLTGQRVTQRAALVSEENLNGIRVLRAWTYPSLHKSFVWRCISFFSFMLTSVIAGFKAGPVDLVMGTSPPLFQAVSAWFVARIRRRPFLLEIRDLWPEFAIEMGVLKNRTLIALSRWLERFLYRRATHLLVNSPAYRDYLLDKGIAADKISFIANGVDPLMFDPHETGHAERDRFGLNGRFVVTYAGALGMANDIATILRAAHELRDQPEIRFLLVGDGKERPKLQALAQDLQLDNVLFAGAQPKSAMPRILAASDACLATLQDIPMFRTTYPNKVFDYMAAGRPTILGIDGVIRDVIEAAEGGIFVSPGNATALAEAVLWLHAHGPEAQRMGQSARRYVEQHFNRQKQAGDFSNLVTALATKTHIPRGES